MGLRLTVLNGSDKPIYQQLYDQIAAQIITGGLVGSYCLPPIRTVASELGISVITVKRAWEELERGGFISTMVGRGCFVRNLTADELEQMRDRLASARFLGECTLYKQLGMSRGDLHRLIDKYYQD